MNDKLLDDEYYKTVIYNTPNTVITNNSISNGYNVCDGRTVNETYEKFLDSLHQVKDNKLLMFHLPSKINIAKKLFDGYLIEEELQEIQYSGRFWDIIRYHLFILVDNDTLVVVDNEKDIVIIGREHAPISLRDKYYE